MDGEHLLHTDAVGHAADGEGLLQTAVLLGDDGALKDLDTLAVAFLDAIMHLDVVANADLRNVLTDLLALDCADVIHLSILTLLEVPRAYADT